MTATPAQSAAMALNAGCDLNCGVTYLHLLEALKQGLVTEESITEAAVRLFTTRFLLGLFDESEYDNLDYEVVECEEHIALADRAARESIVLLKNDGILPLNVDKLRTIGVIGPNADSRKPLVGNYHGTSSEYITVAEGIRNYVDGKVRVLFSEGCGLFEDKTEALAFAGDRLAEARIVAEHSDVVVLCLGLDETLEGEEGDTGNSYASGDKTDLLLPKPQRDLMEAVASVGKPVILCLMTGSAMDLRYPAEHFNAVVQLWYPGARGGRNAAEILFGAVSPSGKLPVTFYEDSDRLPEFTDYRMAGRTYRYMEEKAQYPFGFGLTYGDVAVTAAEAVGTGREEMSVKVTLQNKGLYDTDDVVQIYIKNTDSAYALKNPALCAFKRVHVKAGETVQTVLRIAPKAFTVVTPVGERMMDGRCFDLYAATFQPDERSRELMGREAVKVPLCF